jgi:hypothetical protein
MLVAFCTFTQAQSFNSGKNRRTFKGIKTQYPHHGLGFKLGDPVAITYKFYGSEKFSFGIDFGAASSGLYNRYFRSRFSTYVRSDTFRTSEASVTYAGHKVRSDLVGEVKFCYHIDAKNLAPGLQLYIGGGWEFKNTNIDFTYFYNNASVENRPGSFQRTRLTMGPQIIAGLEYGYTSIPVSAFLEMEYFSDVQVDPGWNRFEGGVGLRYLF